MADEKKTAAAAGKQVRIRSKVGDMVHLHTGAVVDATERKMDLDAFVQAQIDAGKWEIVAD